MRNPCCGTRAFPYHKLVYLHKAHEGVSQINGRDMIRHRKIRSADTPRSNTPALSSFRDCLFAFASLLGSWGSPLPGHLTVQYSLGTSETLLVPYSFVTKFWVSLKSPTVPATMHKGECYFHLQAFKACNCLCN